MRRVAPMLFSFNVMQTKLSCGQKPKVCPMKLRTSDGVVIVSFSMIPCCPFTLWCCRLFLRSLVVGVILVGDHPLGRGTGVQLGEPAPGRKLHPQAMLTGLIKKFSVPGSAR